MHSRTTIDGDSKDSDREPLAISVVKLPLVLDDVDVRLFQFFGGLYL